MSRIKTVKKLLQIAPEEKDVKILIIQTREGEREHKYLPIAYSNEKAEQIFDFINEEVTFSNTGVLSLVAGNNITLTAGTGDITVGFNNRVDIIGSVFGDDSTMLVDGTNGVLRGTHIGSLTGNVTGNVTGNTAGTHTGPVVGNVTGNLSGYHTGDTTGSVFAQDSSLMINGVDGKITGRVETTSVVASAYIQTATYANLSAITAAYPVATKGMIVFDDGTDQFRGYDGNSWVALN
jgi:hypothetical protein